MNDDSSVTTNATQPGSASAPPPLPDHPPVLWNPNAAALWSLIFSPAFGAFLHSRNAKVLGREQEAKLNKRWFYVSLGYFGVLSITTFVPVVPDAFFKLGGIVLLVGWYLAVGKKQITYVKVNWQENYGRKAWTAPLLIACGCLIMLFVTLTVEIAQAWRSELRAQTAGSL